MTMQVQEASVTWPVADAAAIGLKTVLVILDRWQMTAEQQMHVLQLSRSAYYKHKKDPSGASLSRDQLLRISYLLNIHAALRTLFDNPENQQGFMAMPNQHPFFNGATPLQLIGSGDFGALYEVHKHIDGLRGGLW